jgi:hypothetical protein
MRGHVTCPHAALLPAPSRPHAPSRPEQEAKEAAYQRLTAGGIAAFEGARELILEAKALGMGVAVASSGDWATSGGGEGASNFACPGGGEGQTGIGSAGLAKTQACPRTHAPNTVHRRPAAPPLARQARRARSR